MIIDCRRLKSSGVHRIVIPLLAVIAVFTVYKFSNTVSSWKTLSVCREPPAPPFSGRHDVTVVTMYLDLGSLKKGEAEGNFQNPDKYRQWMKSFALISNPVVAFIEKENDLDYFRSLRSHFPANMTRVIRIHRADLASFELLPAISAIYADPSYPKHKPNTVIPEYTVAMHAKYDVLQRAVLLELIEQSFHTSAVAWVDVGYFRDLVGCLQPVEFELMPPADFDASSVAFTQIGSDDILKEDVATIVKENMVWVGGGMVLAKNDVMVKFAKDYNAYVRKLLNSGLSNTDQQVIASMYSDKIKNERPIKLQTYKCVKGEWFCLGNTCRQQGLEIQRQQIT